MSSYTTTCVGIFCMALVAIVPTKVHSMNICSFKIYPDYIWTYAIHLYTTPGFGAFGLIILCAWSKNLLTYTVREVKSDLKHCLALVCQENA